MFSTDLFVCPFVHYKSCEHNILQANEPILLQIGTSSAWGKGMKRSALRAEGHRKPKLDLEAWWRHHSRPP